MRQVRIAIVKPIFTTTAYSSFYNFFHQFANAQAGKLVYANLPLLNTTIVDDWGPSSGLYSFVTSEAAKRAGIIVGNNTAILTDIGVNDGKLFDSSTGARRFDVVVLGFTEYVTANEYSNFKHFVATGGKIIFLTACNFLAEVRYSPTANKLALVEGHGWIFNGSAAWKGPYHRWYAENSNWIGSEYALFYTAGYHINGAMANTSQPLSQLLRNSYGQHVFGSYRAHEENIITNSTDRIIAYWQISNLRHPNWIVAAYEHDYQKGMVIHSGVFGTDIIATDKQFQHFVVESIFLKSSNAQSAVIGVAIKATRTSFMTLISSTRSNLSTRLLASSRGNLFVGAVAGGGYIYVGLLNGSVEKMDPLTGLSVKTLPLPDRNSAAHLLYYKGSLYVGTEFLKGARDIAPYHIYRIDPRTMQIQRQLPMQSDEANGFVFAFNGYLWSGDGRCTLLKISPDTLSVLTRVQHVAEDEMIYDGMYFWTECSNAVSVLRPDSLTVVATGALPYPGRPRGFFEIGSSVYSVNTANFLLYRMSISGHIVIFKNVRTLINHSLTRDTFSKNGHLYVYGIRNDAHFQARIFVYDANFSLMAVVTLPGNGLPNDASQHSMFLMNGVIYFVTASSIGSVALVSGITSRSFSTTQSETSTATGQSNANTILSSPPGQPGINRRLLILSMFVIGLIFTVVYLRRARVSPA